MTHISVISPIYKGEPFVHQLVQRIQNTLITITNNYEIILVDDLSPDRSWEIINDLSSKDYRIKGIKLSKNFGQHYAITCGLDHSSGDWVIVMDCDLQDQPEAIPTLYQKTKDGYDIVMAQREMRTDGFFKKTFSKMFYFIFNFLTNTEHDSSIANFGIYSRKVIDAFNKIKEPNRSFSLLIRWLGFAKTYVPIEHGKRGSGRSSYTLRKLISLATNVIIAFSNKPLNITIMVGFIISFFSFLIGVYYLFLYSFKGIVVQGYTSIIISIWFLSGLIIFFLGVIGLYISKVFESVKSRPLYIIDKKINI
jgi:glycosyltransferase involved in cell wall biosynthesis